MKRRKGKKLYSILEIYVISVNAFRSVKDFKVAKRSGLVDEKLRERIMLAVTGVNKCEMCSYAHTKMAFDAGLTEDEIKAYLDYEVKGVPLEDAKAVMFAQHYADCRGRVSVKAWRELVRAYGIKKARGILAAIRFIMFGNATGIIAGSIKNRLKGEKPDPRSSILYELAFVILFIPILLDSMILAFILNGLNAPKVQCKC